MKTYRQRVYASSRVATLMMAITAGIASFFIGQGHQLQSMFWIAAIVMLGCMVVMISTAPGWKKPLN